MSGEGQTTAIERIERALARIEAAAASAKSPAATSPTASITDDPTLARRHAALRARVEGAIASLDAIIAAPDDD